MSCTSANHELRMMRVPNGMSIVDVVPDSDTAILRKIFIKKFLNGQEVFPVITIPDYTTNQTTFFLNEGFSYAISHEKTCTDGTVSHEYWGTFDIPKIEAPNTIDAQPTAESILMTVPLNNNYATLARYKRSGTSFWYTNPGQNKTDKFTIAPLQPDTNYDVEVCYILSDKVTSSAFTIFPVKTLPASLSGLVINGSGLYLTATVQNTQCEIRLNGKTLRYAIVAKGDNALNLGIIPNVGDVISIIYFGHEYTVTKK